MPNLKIRVATAQTQYSLRRGISNLIDGDILTPYASADKPPEKAWVQLILKTVGTVHYIKITNRVDCCGFRLKDMEVRVGEWKVTLENPRVISRNPVCGTYKGPGKDGEVVYIQCSPPLKGRYVTIQTLASGSQEINMAEVEVVGLS